MGKGSRESTKDHKSDFDPIVQMGKPRLRKDDRCTSPQWWRREGLMQAVHSDLCSYVTLRLC
jgi:hypothetical protein